MDVRPPNETLTGRAPLDRPRASRPHRLYFALTNHCNRACPWCSTCSSPSGSTSIEPSEFRALLPADGLFEVQLEGGEPTLHPAFWELVRMCRTHVRCARLVVVTNGTRLPRDASRLAAWLERFGDGLTLKLSINHYLLEHDPGLLDLACLLAAGIHEPRALVLNVRLRPGRDADIVARVEAAGLAEVANVFFLQRYGFAADERDWEAPFVVGTDFTLVNPDGALFGPDLVARSEAMRRLK